MEAIRVSGLQDQKWIVVKADEKPVENGTNWLITLVPFSPVETNSSHTWGATAFRSIVLETRHRRAKGDEFLLMPVKP